MVDAVITIRKARLSDVMALAAVHDAAWRDAYRGIIPGRELERMIARRGPRWWEAAIVRRSRIIVLEFEDELGGYASYGPTRVPALPFKGEVYELYLSPEYQGLGFGSRLFEAARSDLAEHGYPTALVWALADNDRALGFYRKLGGVPVREAQEKFAGEYRSRIAFGFAAP